MPFGHGMQKRTNVLFEELEKPDKPQLQNRALKTVSERCFNKHPDKTAYEKLIEFLTVYKIERRAGKLKKEDIKAFANIIKTARKNWPQFFKARNNPKE